MLGKRVALGAVVILACGKSTSQAPTASSTELSTPADATVSKTAERTEPTADRFAPALEANLRADESAPLVLRFNWSPPCKVPARQFVNKKGTKSLFSFDLVIEDAADILVVRLANMRLESSDEDRANKREMLEHIASSVIPSFTVSRDGAFVAVREIDALLGEVLELVGVTAESQIGQLLASNEMRALIEQSGGNQWNAWVATWLGVRWEPGKLSEETVRMPSPAGPVLPTTIRRQHRGEITGAPSLVLLTLEQTSSGPEVEAAVKAFLEQVSARAGKPQTVPDSALRGYRVERTIQAAIAPDGPRPYRVRQEQTVSVSSERVVVVRDTVFDWPAAAGCDNSD